MELMEALNRRAVTGDAAATVSTVINGEIDVSEKPPAANPSRAYPAKAVAQLARAVLRIGSEAVVFKPV